MSDWLSDLKAQREMKSETERQKEDDYYKIYQSEEYRSAVKRHDEAFDRFFDDLKNYALQVKQYINYQLIGVEFDIHHTIEKDRSGFCIISRQNVQHGRRRKKRRQICVKKSDLNHLRVDKFWGPPEYKFTGRGRLFNEFVIEFQEERSLEPCEETFITLQKGFVPLVYVNEEYFGSLCKWLFYQI